MDTRSGERGLCVALCDERTKKSTVREHRVQPHTCVMRRHAHMQPHRNVYSQKSTRVQAQSAGGASAAPPMRACSNIEAKARTCVQRIGACRLQDLVAQLPELVVGARADHAQRPWVGGVDGFAAFPHEISHACATINMVRRTPHTHARVAQTPTSPNLSGTCTHADWKHQSSASLPCSGGRVYAPRCASAVTVCLLHMHV